MTTTSSAVTTATPKEWSPRTLARTAGLLYLLVAVLGSFALIFVDGRIYVPGDSVASAANVLANPLLMRLGVVADLLQATFFVMLAMVLHVLLSPVQKNVAGAMVVLVAIATGMMGLNAVFRFEGLQVALNGGYAEALGVAGSNVLVLLLLDLQHYGFLLAQMFFGLWLIPLGYLAHRSGLFPKALALVLALGGLSYLIDLLLAFLAPELNARIHGLVVVPATIAEVWLLGYLLGIGVRMPRPAPSSLAVAI